MRVSTDMPDDVLVLPLSLPLWGGSGWGYSLEELWYRFALLAGSFGAVLSGRTD